MSSSPHHQIQAPESGCEFGEGDGLPSDPLPCLRLDSTGPISGAWLDRFPRQPVARPARIGTPRAVSGESLLCRCPECGGPMSIRMWLQLADCWRCGTSLELAALVDRVRRQKRVAREPATMPRRSRPAASPAASRDRTTARQPVDRTDRAAAARPAGLVPPPRPTTVGTGLRSTTRNWRDLLLTAPAWLVSLLLHLFLLVLLGLLNLPEEVPVRGITLSTAISGRVRSGGRVRLESTDEPQFDLPVPQRDRPQNEIQRQALVLADQDARRIRLDPRAQDPHLPPLAEVRRLIGTDRAQRMFAVRDPRVRVDLVQREGGTTWTEAAVARGLRWMAQHQRSDGSWSLDRFAESGDCRGRCSGQAQLWSDSAATALCLLPFLGAGQTHRFGGYQDVVDKGLSWLVAHQDYDGDLRIDSRGTTAMYAHGQATIVLCEAYAMTGDPQLRSAAQAAIDFIVAAQHPAGGWRYRPGEEGDTSVLGWQLMALQSARVAGLYVPRETWQAAERYLDRAMTADGVTYAYRPGQGPSHVMTAEALLCRMYLGGDLQEAGLRRDWNCSRKTIRRVERNRMFTTGITQRKRCTTRAAISGTSGICVCEMYWCNCRKRPGTQPAVGRHADHTQPPAVVST